MISLLHIQGYFSFFINIPNLPKQAFYTLKQGYPYVDVERVKTTLKDHFSTKIKHFSPIFADLIS
jgi:hypothetical protein